MEQGCRASVKSKKKREEELMEQGPSNNLDLEVGSGVEGTRMQSSCLE